MYVCITNINVVFSDKIFRTILWNHNIIQLQVFVRYIIIYVILLLYCCSVCQRLQRAIRMNDGGNDGAVDFSPGNEIKVQFSSWLAIYGRRFPTPALPPRRHLQSRYEIEWRKSRCTYVYIIMVRYDVVWWFRARGYQYYTSGRVGTYIKSVSDEPPKL